MERVIVNKDPITLLSAELVQDKSVTGRWDRFQQGDRQRRVLVIERDGKQYSMFRVEEDGQTQEIPGLKITKRIDRGWPTRGVYFIPNDGSTPIVLEDHEF